METKILKHLKENDPVLYSYIDKIEAFEWSAGKNLFADLCDAIISQQLSEKAGTTIWNRFKKLFPDEHVTAEYLISIPDQNIRDAGTSWSKVRSLKDLAERVLDKSLNLEKLPALTSEEVIKELVQVKGIGPWTAEIYGFKKEPTIKQVEKIVEKWSPYKSYACRVLWKILEIKS